MEAFIHWTAVLMMIPLVAFTPLAVVFWGSTLFLIVALGWIVFIGEYRWLKNRGIEL